MATDLTNEVVAEAAEAAVQTELEATAEERQAAVDNAPEFADQLRNETAAVRLRKSHLGIFRKLTGEQAQRQAQVFSADPEFVRAKKKLLNTRNPKFRAVESLMSAAGDYWKAVTVPYPERGLRLIRRDRVDEFNARMTEFLDELTDAIAELEESYRTEIIPEAQIRLGDLFNAADYPASLQGHWRLDWEFPSVEPPDYLRELNPRLWEQQNERAEARFAEAVRLTEAAFIEELQRLVAAIVDRLTPTEVHAYNYAGPSEVELNQRKDACLNEQAELIKQIEALGQGEAEEGDAEAQESLRRELEEREAEQLQIGRMIELAQAELIERRDAKITLTFEGGDGQRRHRKRYEPDNAEEARQWLTAHGCSAGRTFQENKVFQSSSVDNLTEFFERFRALNIGNNAELDALVDEAQGAVSGLTAGKLRSASVTERDQIRAPLAGVQDRLDEMLTDRPSRAITLEDDE